MLAFALISICTHKAKELNTRNVGIYFSYWTPHDLLKLSIMITYGCNFNPMIMPQWFIFTTLKGTTYINHNIISGIKSEAHYMLCKEDIFTI